MEVDTGSLIVAAAAFFGVIVSPIIAAVMNGRQAWKDRKDNQRKEWHNFLFDRMNQLISLQGTLNPPIKGAHRNLVLHVRSQAISTILSVDDDTMHAIAAEMPVVGHTDEDPTPVDEVISKAVVG